LETSSIVLIKCSVFQPIKIMLQVVLSKRDANLLKMTKDEENEWIAYLYDDCVLKLVHLTGKDVYEIPNVKLFTFCRVLNVSCLIIIQLDGFLSTWTVYEYTGVHWSVIPLEIEVPKEIVSEKGHEQNQLPLSNILLDSRNGTISLYSSLHHSLYFWTLCKINSKFRMTVVTCFNTFSKIDCISMSRTLVVLGCQQSVQIYNWRYIQTDQQETGRSLYLPKRLHEKIVEIKSMSNTKFLVLLSNGDLYALNSCSPFDDDYFIKVTCSTRIKAFDVVEQNIILIGKSNQIEIASIKDILKQKKEAVDLEVSVCLLLNEEVDKICAPSVGKFVVGGSNLTMFC
jgi:hypothetical protein